MGQLWPVGHRFNDPAVEFILLINRIFAMIQVSDSRLCTQKSKLTAYVYLYERWYHLSRLLQPCISGSIKSWNYLTGVIWARICYPAKSTYQIDFLFCDQILWKDTGYYWHSVKAMRPTCPLLAFKEGNSTVMPEKFLEITWHTFKILLVMFRWIHVCKYLYCRLPWYSHNQLNEILTLFH